MGNDNLLKEVDDDKIPAVLDELKADGNWPFSFLMHQTIKMMQEFKKSSFVNFKQRLFWIGSSFAEGTFVVLTTFKGSSSGITYVHVYSCGDEVPNITQALQDSTVPWTSDQLIFDVVYGSVRAHVLQALKTKDSKYKEVTNSIYWINPDDPHKLDDRNPPSDVSVVFLNEGHAKEINDKWSLKFLDSENVIKDCILSSIGMGVVRKSDRKLLSHAVCNHAGAIFILWTEPEERRKGHAGLLICGLIKELTKRGRLPTAIIPNNNQPTEQLLKKFDFVPFIPTKYYGVTNS